MNDLLVWDMWLEFIESIMIIAGWIDMADFSGYLKWFIMPVILLYIFL